MKECGVLLVCLHCSGVPKVQGVGRGGGCGVRVGGGVSARHDNDSLGGLSL